METVALYLAWHEETASTDSASYSSVVPDARQSAQKTAQKAFKKTAQRDSKQKSDRASHQADPASVSGSTSLDPKMHEYNAELSYFYSGYFYF
jgi:hypothetical protein